MPAPLRGLFVAGTDTNVGKTFLSCALLQLAQRRGFQLIPYKPAESGTKRGHPGDAAALRAAAQADSFSLSQICPHQFTAPIAPAAATLSRGRHLTLSSLVRPARALLVATRQTRGQLATTISHSPALLIEAAGGLLSPYAPTLTGADLAAALGLPILLVARDALGTINHTALAIAECRRRGLALAAVALVATTPSHPATRRQRNADLIESLTGIRPWAVPHFRGPASANLPSAANHLARSGLGDFLLGTAFAPAPDKTPTAPRVRRRPSSGR
jgi:dethiobiotin synthetase